MADGVVGRVHMDAKALSRAHYFAGDDLGPRLLVRMSKFDTSKELAHQLVDRNPVFAHPFPVVGQAAGVGRPPQQQAVTGSYVGRCCLRPRIGPRPFGAGPGF